MSGLGVAVVIPARSEAATLGAITRAISQELMEGPNQAVAELVVADDGSSDETAEVAVAGGAKVVQVVGATGTRPMGKGAALAAGLAATTADLVVFIDGDLMNFEADWVERLAKPLVDDNATVLVKATYRRPMADGSTEGGRVTEILARPLLERFFPGVAGIRQPLSGEWAVRRSALTRIDLAPGYAVDVGVLIDVLLGFGAGAIAQVDLGVRRHRNRSLDALGLQARAILDIVLDRAGID